MSQPVRFITNPICPFAHRAWIALEFHAQNNDLKYKTEEVSLKEKPQWFTDFYHKALGHDPNSTGKVPVIEHDGNVITESDICANYIDHYASKTSGKSLVPSDPYEKAVSQVFANDACSRMILPFYKLLNAETDEDKEHWSSKLHEAIRWINDRLQEYHPIQQGEEDAFVLGEKLSIGDILVFPWIHRLPVVQHYRGFEVPDSDEYSRFNKWVKAVSNHPATKATLTQSADYFIDQYKVYASGERKV
eukprot:gb/GECG01010881.1/.p1 GENE.gb/GECG01010881.1/~~gb/GECG01010881.1/.p1  ORF type:complete len:247 (+),score=31.97 gb/GECG01010881.1/:1-741(+)